MNRDSAGRATGATRPICSRRNFMRVAAASGGVGLLNAWSADSEGPEADLLNVWVAKSQYEGIRVCGAVLRALAVIGTVCSMRDVFILAIHLLVTLVKLVRPGGGVRAVAAESLLLKHQLLISNRCHHRAPNLTTLDRVVLGLTTLFVSPRRIPKLGALLKPATLPLSPPPASLDRHAWRQHCHGLFEMSIAA
jgi:hypothetical protein